MMLSRKSVKLFLLLVFLNVNLFAIDGKIKVFLKNNDTIYTSQKVTVSIELLSNAFSITDVRITFPTSEKYIVHAPPGAAFLGKEEIEGEDWQMVHYDYEVYALRSGKIVIPPFSISFSASMGYGQPKKEFDLKSEALHFDVNAPKGVKSNQFVLVTDNFTLVSEMRPKKKQIIVGDAVELSILQKANHVPDILLRPISYKSNTFLRVYDKEPKLKSDLKGKFDVSRTDSFTFVASAEGNVTLPSQEMVWWNSVTEETEVETIPEISFEILPDPQIALDAKKAEQKQRLIYIGVALFLLVMSYLLFAARIKEYLHERKKVYVLSEEGRFKTLLNSCHKSDETQVYHHFYDWLEAVDPTLPRVGFSGISDIQPSFSKALLELEEVLTVPEKAFDRTGFINELKKFREVLLKQNKTKQQGLPSRINP